MLMQKAKESRGNGKQSQDYTQVEYGLAPPSDTIGEMDYTITRQKKKIPYIPIAIGLVVILGAIGAIIYIKKSK